MTTEQLAELAEALSILSAKSSVLKERDELRVLMEENTSAEEVVALASFMLEPYSCNILFALRIQNHHQHLSSSEFVP